MPDTPPADAVPTLGIGKYYSDLAPGQRYRTLARTITEPDIVNFIGVTGMVETMFTDLTFRKGAALSGRLAPAALTYTFIEGLLVQSIMQTTGLALLEIEKKVLAPVFAGDTVRCELEVLSVRKTSRGNRGIVKTRNDVFNQRGEKVMTYTVTRMMAGRPAED